MGCCNCKSKTTKQGSKYCQNCLPHEMQWLVPVSKEPDPFMMDTNHAYMTPDNKMWVLSHDRTRAFAVNGELLDIISSTNFALKSDIKEYVAGTGINISEDNEISTTFDPTKLLATLRTLNETVNFQQISIDSMKEVIRVVASEKPPVYDDVPIKTRIEILENTPDKDTTYTAGLNVNISQDNVISVDFQELLERLQQVNVFNEEQQLAIEQLKEATKRIRVYKKGQGIDITDDLTINGWTVQKTVQGTNEIFKFVGPKGEEIFFNNDTRSLKVGDGVTLSDDKTISLDYTKVATKEELRVLSGGNTTYVEEINGVKERLQNVESRVDQDTTYKAGQGLSLDGDTFKNTGQTIPLTSAYGDGRVIPFASVGIKDANLVVKSGFYGGAGVLNLPKEGPVVLESLILTNSEAIQKVVTIGENPEVFTRVKQNSIWTQWTKNFSIEKDSTGLRTEVVDTLPENHADNPEIVYLVRQENAGA